MEQLQKMDKVLALSKAAARGEGIGNWLTDFFTAGGKTPVGQPDTSIINFSAKNPVNMPITPWGRWITDAMRRAKDEYFKYHLVPTFSPEELLSASKHIDGLTEYVKPVAKALSRKNNTNLESEIYKQKAEAFRDPLVYAKDHKIKWMPASVAEQISLLGDLKTQYEEREREAGRRTSGIVLGDVGLTALGAGMLSGGYSAYRNLQPVYANKKKKLVKASANDSLSKGFSAARDNPYAALKAGKTPAEIPENLWGILFGNRTHGIHDAPFLGWRGGALSALFLGPAAYMAGSKSIESGSEVLRDKLLEKRKAKAQKEYQQLLAESLAKTSEFGAALDKAAEAYVAKEAGVGHTLLAAYLLSALGIGGVGFSVGKNYARSKDKNKVDAEAYEKAIKIKQLSKGVSTLQLPLQDDNEEPSVRNVLRNRYKSYMPIPKPSVEGRGNVLDEESSMPDELAINKLGSFLVNDTLKKKCLIKISEGTSTTPSVKPAAPAAPQAGNSSGGFHPFKAVSNFVSNQYNKGVQMYNSLLSSGGMTTKSDRGDYRVLSPLGRLVAAPGAYVARKYPKETGNTLTEMGEDNHLISSSVGADARSLLSDSVDNPEKLKATIRHAGDVYTQGQNLLGNNQTKPGEKHTPATLDSVNKSMDNASGMMTMAQGLKDNPLGAIWNIISTKFTGTLNKLGGWSGIWKAIWQWIQNLWGGIKQTFGGIGEGLFGSQQAQAPA